MNKFFKYMAASAIVAAAGLTSCQDDFDNYDFSVPAATLQPNTTIRELKEAMWADSLNYCHQVGLRPDGSNYVIKGTVISSDAAGNLYRTFYIADATAAIAISYNSYDICLTYRPGQEIVVDMTGQFVGKYNGMEEIGTPKWDFSRMYTTTSFMTPRYFDRATQLNGLPQLNAIDTLTLSTKPLESKDALLEYQGRLVRFNNVTFKPQGGITTLADAFQSSGYSQPFFLSGSTTDSINVRTSGYSDFWNTQLPTEPCDVVGILGYYNNGSTKDGWQLLLIDPQGLMNVGNPTVAGDKAKPYTVEQAIEAINSGSSNSRAWVKGYVVGTVAPEATSVTGNGDIQFEAPFVLGNTVVLAPSADCRDWTQCMVIELPEASELWAAANLVDNPDVLHQSLAINGRMVANVLGTYGVTGFQGTSADFYIGDLQVPVEPNKGNGTETSPYSVEQVRGLGNPGSNSWVEGYIVGSCTGKDFASGTFSADGASYSNILLADSPDETELNNCIPVQLVAQTELRTAVNLADNPGNLGRKIKIQGSLIAYFGQTGVKTPTAWEFLSEGNDNPVTPPVGGDEGSESNPYTVEQFIAAGVTNKDVWVTGAIVGFINGNVFMESLLKFTAEGAKATNILLAPAAGVTDPAKCIVVTLPANSDVRAKLNLRDNPANLGKTVSICGTSANVFGATGLSTASACKF